MGNGEQLECKKMVSYKNKKRCGVERGTVLKQSKFFPTK